MAEENKKTQLVIATCYAPAIANNSDEIFHSIVCYSTEFYSPFYNTVKTWLQRYDLDGSDILAYLNNAIHLFSGVPIGCSGRKMTIELASHTTVTYWHDVFSKKIFFQHDLDFLKVSIRSQDKDKL